MSVHYFYSVNKKITKNVNLTSLHCGVKQLSGKPLRKSEKTWKECAVVLKCSTFKFNPDWWMTCVFFLISCHPAGPPGPCSRRSPGFTKSPATLLCGLGTLSSLSLSFLHGDCNALCCRQELYETMNVKCWTQIVAVVVFGAFVTGSVGGNHWECVEDCMRVFKNYGKSLYLNFIIFCTNINLYFKSVFHKPFEVPPYKRKSASYLLTPFS